MSSLTNVKNANESKPKTKTSKKNTTELNQKSEKKISKKNPDELNPELEKKNSKKNTTELKPTSENNTSKNSAELNPEPENKNSKKNPDELNPEIEKKNTKKPVKKTQKKKISKKPITNEKLDEYDYNLIDIAKLIMNEINCIKKYKIPTKVRTFNENLFEDNIYIINEDVNPHYETQLYMMYMYKKINNHYINEFKRVIYPINDYESLYLEKFYTNLQDFPFLYIFADIKNDIDPTLLNE